MINIQELLILFIEYQTENTSLDNCIKWAENQLVSDENNDDPDIVLLAGASTSMKAYELTEVHELIEKILAHHLGSNAVEERLHYGKYLVKIYDRYKNDKYTIEELEVILIKIEIKFDYSFEMGYLYNFCDFVWMNGVEPFEKEFEYIAEIWRNVNSLEEFNQIYDEKISQSHAAKMKVISSYSKYYNVIIFIIIITITISITLYKNFFYK